MGKIKGFFGNVIKEMKKLDGQKEKKPCTMPFGYFSASSS